MRVAQREHHRALALHLGAVADANDLQILGPTVGDAAHRVVDQSARQAMNGAFGFVFASHHDMAVLLCQGHPARQVVRHRALWPFDRHGIAVNRKANALGHWNRLFSNSRHACSPHRNLHGPGLPAFVLGLRLVCSHRAGHDAVPSNPAASQSAEKHATTSSEAPCDAGTQGPCTRLVGLPHLKPVFPRPLQPPQTARPGASRSRRESLRLDPVSAPAGRS